MDFLRTWVLDVVRLRADAVPAGSAASDGSASDAGEPLLPDAGQDAPSAPPQHRGLVPRWFVIWGAWTLGSVAVALIAAALLSRAASVRAPDLSRLDTAHARTRAAAVGLTLVVRDRAFSADVPAGLVTSQTPRPGTDLASGSTILVDLSAGSERFAMPDVIGSVLAAARLTLKNRGLAVDFETAPSDAVEGTIISSLPSPGETVTTGDTVRLVVAAGVSTTSTLLPADLSGLTFVLDPMPAASRVATDPAFDVARRVRALLAASGANVIVTRDVAGNASPTERLKRANAANATALVGFRVDASGPGGLRVLQASATGGAYPLPPGAPVLAHALRSSLSSTTPSIVSTGTADDLVLARVRIPAVRIRLGSHASSGDRASLSDPTWADGVARAVYRALAQVYGKR